MEKYPYIQKKETVEGFCEICGTKGNVLSIEWRVDWFQGNCEFETVCCKCFSLREEKSKKKRREYEKRMKPIWDKERKEKEKINTNFMKVIEDSGIEIKKYDNGQWTLNGIIDWWTTTGTAIHRKTRERFFFSKKDPEFIIKIVNK